MHASVACSLQFGLFARIGFFAQSAPTAAPVPSGLSPAGWIFMCASISGVLILVVWCYRRLLSDSSRASADPMSSDHD